MKKEKISAIVSDVSLQSTIFAQKLPLGAKILIVLLGITGIAYLSHQTIADNRITETVLSSDEEIQERIKEIAKTQSEICISSKDLSWMNEEIESIIADNAANILLFVRSETAETRKLAGKGVRVKYYGETGFTPTTRFTLVQVCE